MRSGIAFTAMAMVLWASVMPVSAMDAQPTSLTRAGALALIVESHPRLRARAQWYDEHMPPMPLFTDVDQHLWYAPYIEAAFEAGIVEGNDDRTFRPGALISSEETIAFMTRYKEATGTVPTVLSLKKDYPVWYSEALSIAKIYNIALPERIRIGQPVARTEFNAMLSSMGVKDPQTIALSIDMDRGVNDVIPAVGPPRLVASATTIVEPRPAATQPRPSPAVSQSRPTTTTTTTTPRPTQVVIARPVVPAPARPAPAVTQPRPAVTQPRPTTTTSPRPQPTTAQAASGDRPEHASSRHFAITMPTLGVKDLSISHPTNAATSQGLLAPLKTGVGHLFSFPGKGGKILVYGHSSSYSWDVSAYTKIFRQINKLNVGDKVYITYNNTLYTYQVTKKQAVPAKDLSAYKGGGGEELILYTCWPPDSITQRYLVHAKPVEAVALK